MIKKTLIALAVLLVAFLAYVASRPGHFKYQRSGLINARPEQIYPYISQIQKGVEWSPYEKDPDQKRTFGGTEGQPGNFEEWDGKQMGSGRVEITSVKPNERVELRLHMIKPMEADNKVVYTLTPEGEATKFTWSMEGDGGFVGKLISTFIDCEKMIGGQFDEGIANLKRVVESKK